jgi:hypothetical protein
LFEASILASVEMAGASGTASPVPTISEQRIQNNRGSSWMTTHRECDEVTDLKEKVAHVAVLVGHFYFFLQHSRA